MKTDRKEIEAKLQKAFIKSDFGHDIHYAVLKQAVTEGASAKGAVMITTGFAGTIKSSIETIAFYYEQGYDVYIMEWAGHGASGLLDHKRAASTKGCEIYVADMKRCFEQITVAPGQKKILSTHSMGGLVALHYLATHPKDFDQAILVNPLMNGAVQTGTPSFKGKIGRAFGRALLKGLVQAGLADKKIPSARTLFLKGLIADEFNLSASKADLKKLDKIYERYKDQFYLDEISFGLIERNLAALENLRRENILRKIETPLMIALGLEDYLVSNKAALLAESEFKKVSYVLVPEAGHRLWGQTGEGERLFKSAVQEFLAHAKLARAIYAPAPLVEKILHKPPKL